MSRPRPVVVEALGAELDTRFECLVGDASTRRFVRVYRGGGTAIVMDYGEPFSGESGDEQATTLFRRAGLPVPAVLERHPEAGFLLLEDLGDTLLEKPLRSAAGRGEPPSPWLDAVRLAARIADEGTPVLADRAGGMAPTLDRLRFRFEMDFFLEHYVLRLRGRTPDLPLRRALHTLADEAADTPRKVLCHRDYHCRNLLIREDGGLAMVDIQDSQWGPDSYDLASLARDAYVEIPDSWVERAIDTYCGALREPPAGDFRRRFDVTSAQRMIKALGTFGYQTGARGGDRYREPIPRTLARLAELLPRLAGHERLSEILRERGLLEA